MENKKSSIMPGVCNRENKQWDESSFMVRLMSQKEEAELSVAQKILERAKSKGVYIWWGKSATGGTFFPCRNIMENNSGLFPFL